MRAVAQGDTIQQGACQSWLVIVAAIILLLFPACGGGQLATAGGKKSPSAKADHDLAALYSEYMTFVQGGRVGAFKPSNPHIRVIDGRVVIDAVASGQGKDLLADLQALGMQEGATFGRLVSGQLPIGAIYDLNGLESLKFARPAYAITHGKSPRGTGAVVGQDRQIKD